VVLYSIGIGKLDEEMLSSMASFGNSFRVDNFEELLEAFKPSEENEPSKDAPRLENIIPQSIRVMLLLHLHM
jgi:hypothetical protein